MFQFVSICALFLSVGFTFATNDLKSLEKLCDTNGTKADYRNILTQNKNTASCLKYYLSASINNATVPNCSNFQDFNKSVNDLSESINKCITDNKKKNDTKIMQNFFVDLIKNMVEEGKDIFKNVSMTPWNPEVKNLTKECFTEQFNTTSNDSNVENPGDNVTVSFIQYVNIDVRACDKARKYRGCVNATNEFPDDPYLKAFTFILDYMLKSCPEPISPSSSVIQTFSMGLLLTSLIVAL